MANVKYFRRKTETATEKAADYDSLLKLHEDRMNRLKLIADAEGFIRGMPATEDEKPKAPYEGGGYVAGVHFGEAAYPRAFETKDSGQREDFSTGSRRDTREGKGRYDLLSPIALRRLAQVYERGSVKYGDNNWRLGQPLSRFLDSALRHTFQVLEGKSDEDHAGQAMWNLCAFIETQERIALGELPQELNDL